MKFLIVSGLSGAGKSKAASILEDFGFYCVDNMPAALIPNFAEICMANRGKYEKVVLVTDVRGGDTFDKLFESGEAAERLRQTNIAVVCLGDDDKNIKAAIMLRSIFDRVNHISNKTLDSKETSRPLIYSLVYDEAKTNVLNKNRLTNGLTNHYGQPLQIDFIGDLKSQYCYETIEEQKQREVVALQYHLEWIRAGALDDGRKNEEQLRVRLLESLSKYVDYEYFRRSSVARALQEEVVKKITNAAGADMSCGTGGRSMLTSEHMRWNMYMRTIGYRYSEIRADRAKMHPDLISVDKLNTAERKKDTPRKGV